MPDVNSPWGGDIAVSPTGDLALVDGDARVQQRILRRLFTAIGNYIFHLDYGADVPGRIGDPANAQVIKAVIYSQILLEGSVAQNPPPVVTVTPLLNGVACVIQYTDAVLGPGALPIQGQQKTLSFDYPPV